VRNLRRVDQSLGASFGFLGFFPQLGAPLLGLRNLLIELAFDLLRGALFRIPPPSS
jgi:hypothetical protein